MNTEKPMSILLIEDDEFEVKEFLEYLKTRNDAEIIKHTNSSYEGIKDTKTYVPEGIILDLELHKGEGSGISFLEELQKTKLEFRPLIVVTTNVSSNIVYNHIHDLGTDFIFYKKQSDYSPEMVINSMVSLRETIYHNQTNIVKTTTETPIEHENRIKDKINNELDLIGVANHLKGRKYLFDAILYLLENDEKNNDSVFYYLSNEFKVGNSSISRAMQTAINYAWRISSIDDLMTHYTARINHQTGVPTPTEFIYYYADKIKKYL
mgnify:FL=1